MDEVTMTLYEQLGTHFAAHDKAAAVRTAVEAVTSGRISIAVLYRDVLTPLLVNAGTTWQRGGISVWEEHLASATVRTVVEILYPGVLKAKAAHGPAGRSALLACPPNENHDLGLRMVVDRFDMAGWQTYYLGPDTPGEDIIDATRRLEVDVVVLSSSTHLSRVALRHFVDSLKAELPNVKVWVGGPAFVRGHEGWSDDEIVDLVRELGEDEAGGPGDEGGEPGSGPGES